MRTLPVVRGANSGYVEAVVECNINQISTRIGHHDAIELEEQASRPYRASVADQHLADVLPAVAISLGHAGDDVPVAHYLREANALRAACCGLDTELPPELLDGEAMKNTARNDASARTSSA